MTSQLILLYQDCPDCGKRKKWFEEQAATASSHGLDIVKFPFWRKGAGKLIKKAAKSETTLPCFTDGTNFSKNVADFVKKDPKNSPENVKTKRKTRARKKKEVNNGDSTDS